MSTNLDEARLENDFVAAQEVLSRHFTLEVLDALNVCVRGVARAVAEDVYAGKEAERLDRRFAAATSPTDTGAGEERPKRIRVGRDAEGFWTCREARSGSQEYVRADLYADLEQRLAAWQSEEARQEARADNAERERDAARTSLEAMERRVGEAIEVAKLAVLDADICVHECEKCSHAEPIKDWDISVHVRAVLTALTPDAGTARSDGEEE